MTTFKTICACKYIDQIKINLRISQWSSGNMLIRDKNIMRVGIFVFSRWKSRGVFWYARGINHHVGIWDSHVNLDPRIYCRDDAHHAPAGEPFPLLPRKRFYLGLHAARATRLLSLILFFFFLSSAIIWNSRASCSAAGSYRSLRPLNIRRRCSLSSSTEITRASNIQHDIG